MCRTSVDLAADNRETDNRKSNPAKNYKLLSCKLSRKILSRKRVVVRYHKWWKFTGISAQRLNAVVDSSMTLSGLSYERKHSHNGITLRPT